MPEVLEPRECSTLEVWTQVQAVASRVGILSAKRSHRDGTQQPSVLPKMAWDFELEKVGHGVFWPGDTGIQSWMSPFSILKLPTSGGQPAQAG